MDVFFVFSKLFGALLHPVWMIAILLGAGLGLSLTRWRGTARLLLAGAAMVLGLGAFTTIGAVLLQPLEARFTRPLPPPEAIAGIIVLGGGMDAGVNEVRRGYELDRGGDRFVEALRLAQRHPDTPIVVAGGSGRLTPREDTEAAAARRFLVALGVAPERVLEEGRSRNTAENARFVAALLGPEAQTGASWLLVTSAFHMPRAMALFRKAGLKVVAWPTDYRTTGDAVLTLSLDQPLDNLERLHLAIREWTGLWVYALTGRIDSVFPAP